MTRFSALLLPVFLVIGASARAADPVETDKDAPLGTRSPATIGWRVPPASLAAPSLSLSRSGPAGTGVTLEMLRVARTELAAEPDGKSKLDLLAALSDLESGAAKAAPEERQGWIDGHLGDFNQTLRTLGADAPAPLVTKAARTAARLNNRAQRWNDSREFAERALGYDPNDRDALISRSQANAGLGDFARAYADAERVAKLVPDSADAFTARANAAYGLGNYLQAIEDARRALALDPENKTAFAIMKLSEGRTRKLPDFEKNEPQLADSIEREYHGMVQQLNQVEGVRMIPVETPAPAGVARFIAASGAKLAVKDYQGAIEDADKALSLDPANPRALYYRAVAHNMTGEYGDAARDATRGLTVLPSDAPLHDARGWAYNRMGRFLEATADAHHSLEMDPRDGYAYANRGYADEQRGDYQAMAEDYKTAAEINPQFEPTYEDAARRHGIAVQALGKDHRVPELSPRKKKQARSFAAVIFSSLLGGLLIALGVLHVSGLTKDAKPAPPMPGVPSTGLEAQYLIGKPIGQGGMGVVYEAMDRKLQRQVAIKMLRDEYKLDDAAKAGFMAEARMVAELHHPGIVDIHSIIEDDRGLYLIFERLTGRTLDQVIGDHKRMPLAEVKKVLKPVCDALGYAHSHDVVHRDLKPSNIMLTENGVKVLDFGISRHAARAGKASTTQTITGTPHYMAPEQEYGFVQKENDVFSLGAVLYELVTGVRPYEGSHQAKLAKGFLRVSTRVSGAPLELDALIDRSLEPDPEKRIKSVAEFWDQLAAIPDFKPTDEA